MTSDEGEAKPFTDAEKAEIIASALQAKKRKLKGSIKEAKVVPIKPGVAAPPGGGGTRAAADRWGMPDGSPVQPLGKNGMTFYYLNPLNELIALKEREHSQSGLRALFSPRTELLETYWPQRKMVEEVWVTVGFKVALGMECLMNACSRMSEVYGLWNNTDNVRGRGGWLDDNGGLMFHLGDRLWRLGADGNPEELKPGRHGGFVYTSDLSMQVPYDERVAGGEGSASEDLYKLLEGWSWERGAIDIHLMVGGLAAGMVGGALDWRPHVFLTGDASTGKSTLQKVARLLHGRNGCIKASNASEAGVAQAIGVSSVPVSLDEAESEANSEHMQKLIELARLSSSGDNRIRAEGGVSGRINSAFMLSAIIMPSMPSQDRRRFAILRLQPLPAGSQSPVINAEYFGDLGAKIKRRLADQWHRFEHTLTLFRTLMRDCGHDHGGAMQFGTLMALAHLVLDDHDPAEGTLATWRKHFAADRMRETADTRSNATSCLDELAQYQPDAYKGGVKRSVAEIVRGIWEFGQQNFDGLDPQAAERDSSDTLASAGLQFVRRRRGGCFLAVPYKHRAVAEIYKASRWKMAPGAVSGGWVEALPRLPGVMMNKTARVGGISIKCLLVPVALVLGEQNTTPAETEEEEASEA